MTKPDLSPVQRGPRTEDEWMRHIQRLAVKRAGSSRTGTDPTAVRITTRDVLARFEYSVSHETVRQRLQDAGRHIEGAYYDEGDFVWSPPAHRE